MEWTLSVTGSGIGRLKNWIDAIFWCTSPRIYIKIWTQNDVCDDKYENCLFVVLNRTEFYIFYCWVSAILSLDFFGILSFKEGQLLKCTLLIEEVHLHCQTGRKFLEGTWYFFLCVNEYIFKIYTIFNWISFWPLIPASVMGHHDTKASLSFGNPSRKR